MEQDSLMDGLATSFSSNSNSSYSEMTTITTTVNSSSSNSSSSQITVKENVSEPEEEAEGEETTTKSCGIIITHEEELTRSLHHSSPGDDISNANSSIPVDGGDGGGGEEDDVIYQSPDTPPDDIEEEPSVEPESDSVDPGSTDGGGDEYHSTEINASNYERDDSDVEPIGTAAEYEPPPTLTAVHETDSNSQQPCTEVTAAAPSSVSSGTGSSREIEQESIKQTLHEIISEIDREMEADFNNEEVEEVVDEEESMLINSAQAAQSKRSPPPVAPKKARPFSVPDDFIQHQEGNATGPISPETGRPIDLQKIFTPASDFSGEMTPRRQRRMYTSSSFYSPLHPSMEEQVELARQISHSLSADTNTNSKGQSMYVKRRNRSSKWIHEVAAAGDSKVSTGGDEQQNSVEDEARMTFKIPNIGPQEIQFRAKSPLKLLMNPKGQVLDLHAMRRTGMHIETQSLSPEICSSLVKDLHTPKGKGAALFAKRKQKSEKWIVDENTVKQKVISHSAAVAATAAAAAAAAPTNNQSNPADPATTSANTRAEQQNKINAVQDRFGGPRVKLVKSPWEAALEDGTVATAFQDMWTSSSSTTAAIKTTTTTSSTTVEESSQTSLTRELISSSSSSMTSSSTVLSAMPVVTPKLNMKPLDTVPKMSPNFKAQPIVAASSSTTAAQEDPVPVEEKPFVLAPLRPESVDIYKLKAPKGWSFTGPSAVGDSLFEPHSNPVMPAPSLLELVQSKELSSSISNSQVKGEEVENVPAPVADIQHQPEEDQPAKEDKKPTPSNGFEFELPVLRSVSASQVAQPIQSEPEPLIVLPTLRPVQVNPPAPVVESEPKLILPTLRPVQMAPPVAPTEPEQPQLVLPALRPVPEQDVPAPSTPVAVEWQIPPLDSRPNLQALLEREQKPTEEVAAAPPPPMMASPKVQPKLRPQPPPVATPAPAPPPPAIIMTEELRMVQEAQLAKLSVRLKVQRFEASNFTLMTPSQAQEAKAHAQSPGIKTPPKPNFSRKTPSAPMVVEQSPAFKAISLPPMEFAAPIVKTINLPEPAPLIMNSSKPASTKENAVPKMRNQQLDAPLPSLPVIQCNPAPPLHQDLPLLPMMASLPLLPAIQLRQSSSSKSLLSEAESTLHRRSLADFTNYNTAPRGWLSAGKDIYRPVTFKMA